MLPYIVHSFGFRSLTSVEDAKLQLAKHWRYNDKVRTPAQIDELVCNMYERLGNIVQQDAWGGAVAYMIAPPDKRNRIRNQGYSYIQEAKYGKKSSFMNDFYTGKNKNVY